MSKRKYAELSVAVSLLIPIRVAAEDLAIYSICCSTSVWNCEYQKPPFLRSQLACERRIHCEH